MKTIAHVLLAAIITSGLLALPLHAEEQLQRYIVVLKQRSGAVPDVASLGGKIEFRQDDQLIVTIPPGALAVLKADPKVRYVEQVGGTPSDDEPPLIGAPSDPRPGPSTQAARFTPHALGTLSWDSGAYVYDGAGNIVSIGADNYLYDGVQRLRQSSTQGTPETYTYDGFGNMKTKTNTIMPTVQPSTNRYDGYGYNEIGAVTSDGSYVFSYDALGQPLSKIYNGDPLKLEYYIYTPGDERIGVQRAGWWTWSVRDETGKVLRQYKSSSTNPSAQALWLEDFVWRDGLLLGSQRPVEMGGRRHFHLDHLGSPRLITADNGQMVSYHDYYPFGDEHSPVSQEVGHGFDREEPMKFTGHERDYAGGMGGEDGHAIDDMHARYYNPTMGRFFEPDPVLGNLLRPQSWNRYAYVLNSSINYTDPSGAITFFGSIDSFCHCPLDSDDTFELDFLGDSQNLATGFFNSHAYRFVSGAANAYASDQLLGAGRVDDDDDDYEQGQIFGDINAAIDAGFEMAAGAGGEVAGVGLDLTGFGAAVGVPVNVISAGVLVHGGAVTAVGAWHAMSGLKQRKAGKHGTFRGRDAKRANDEATKRVARELGLNQNQQQRLHHEVSGGDLSYEEIKAVAKAIFGR